MAYHYELTNTTTFAIAGEVVDNWLEENNLPATLENVQEACESITEEWPWGNGHLTVTRVEEN